MICQPGTAINQKHMPCVCFLRACLAFALQDLANMQGIAKNFNMTTRQDTIQTPLDSMGAKLRMLRTTQGMSLADVAAKTGVSEATMSRIETGRSDVSAPHLFRLSGVFNVDVGSFFQSAAPDRVSGIRSVERRGQGQNFESDRLRSSVLCTDLRSKKMQPFLNHVRGQTVEEVGGLAAHDGEEYLLVQRGQLVLHTSAYAPLPLDPGDSVYFDGAMPHAYVSATTGGADFLVICTTDQHNDQKELPDGN